LNKMADADYSKPWNNVKREVLKETKEGYVVKETEADGRERIIEVRSLTALLEAFK